MKTTPADKSSPVVEKPFWLNFDFQVRRYGFVLLLLIVVAALCGIFSKGYLSDSHLSNTNGSLSLHYEKFNRLMSDADMKIVSVSSPGDRNRIIFGGDFMESFRVDSLQPQPDKMYSLNGEMIIEYDGTPVILVENGYLFQDKMKKADICCDDIFLMARVDHGITRLDEIKFAILETNGHISIVPESK